MAKLAAFKRKGHARKLIVVGTPGSLFDLPSPGGALAIGVAVRQPVVEPTAGHPVTADWHAST
jgi:hypothetical protein